MAALDPAVASVLDRHHSTTHPEEDEDALLSALENETEDDASLLASHRERRLQQLHSEFSRAKQLRENSGHGTYTTIREEKQILDITTSTKLCVVHFLKPDFARCRTMDARLEALAPVHYEARFLRMDVQDAPFLVARLKVQVLPCVICFVDGVGVDRIIGFEGLGKSEEDFTVRELEARLLRAGVLERAKEVGANGSGGTRKYASHEVDDDSGDDWD